MLSATFPSPLATRATFDCATHDLKILSTNNSNFRHSLCGLTHY
jgi:hypothetical protein